MCIQVYLLAVMFMESFRKLRFSTFFNKCLLSAIGNIFLGNICLNERKAKKSFPSLTFFLRNVIILIPYTLGKSSIYAYIFSNLLWASFWNLLRMLSIYIRKQRRSFVCLSVCTFKCRGLQLRKLLEKYQRGFLIRLWRYLFKNLSGFFKKFSGIFVQAIFLFHNFLHLYVILEAFSSEIRYRDSKERFWEDFEAIFFQKSFQII